MRKVDNGELPSTHEKFVSVIAAILKVPANGQSSSFDEMRKVVPVIELMEASVDEPIVYLEDAQFDLVCDRMKGSRFGRNARELLDMLESIFASEKVVPESMPRLVTKDH